MEDDDCAFNHFEYVSNFRKKLTKACDLARKNLKSAHSCMKSKFDKHNYAKFQSGDKVLAFLLLSKNIDTYSEMYLQEPTELHMALTLAIEEIQ